jgi:hypothetical protein
MQVFRLFDDAAGPPPLKLTSGGAAVAAAGPFPTAPGGTPSQTFVVADASRFGSAITLASGTQLVQASDVGGILGVSGAIFVP